MKVEYINIKWNNHFPISIFYEFLENNLFTDVTLYVEDKFIQTHKIILSACSPYFMNLFKTLNDEKKPIICISEISFEIFKLLVKYIYTGKINVNQQEMEQFMHAAERFQILEISKMSTDIIKTEIQKQNLTNTIKNSYKSIPNIKEKQILQDEDFKFKNINLKSGSKNFYKNYKCDKCEKRYSNISSLYRHKKFECGLPPKFKCDDCGKKCKRKDAFKSHLKNCKRKN